MANEDSSKSRESAARSQQQPKVHILIGGFDFGDWCQKIRIENAVSSIPTAEIDLQLDAALGTHLDYLANVQVLVEFQKKQYPRFTGVIETARTDQGLLRLSCSGMAELRDQIIPGFSRIGLGAAEVIWTVARSSGYTSDLLDIDGIEELPLEEIEVFIPLNGVQIGRTLVVGDCQVIPLDDASSALIGFDSSPMTEEFKASKSFVVVRKRERLLFNAEQEALKDAEVVAAWFATQLRYGAATLPDGSLQPFNRAESRALPRVSEVVAVRGLTSGRRWLRVPRFTQLQANAAFPRQGGSESNTYLSPRFSPQDREMLLAFWRALDASTPLGGVIALWDAIEFYSSGISVPKLFSRSELDQLRDWIPATLNPTKRQRLAEKIEELNNSPLFIRLEEALRRDQVPITVDEMEVLRRLRKIRNPAQHGKERMDPVEEDLRRGCSLVARILMYRMHAADPEPS